VAGEIRLGENEIAFELMGFNVSMVAANITTCNEEEEETFKRMNREVQGRVSSSSSPGIPRRL